MDIELDGFEAEFEQYMFKQKKQTDDLKKFKGEPTSSTAPTSATNSTISKQSGS